MDFNLILKFNDRVCRTTQNERGEYPTLTREVNKLQQYCCCNTQGQDKLSLVNTEILS
jgi:hypothetical protein